MVAGRDSLDFILFFKLEQSSPNGLGSYALPSKYLKPLEDINK